MDLPDTLTSRVVLIGGSDYDNLPSLPSCRSNIEALGNLLLSKDLWGIPNDNITRVHSPSTSRHIFDPIANAAEAAEDTLLVYFAGHGLINPVDGELLISLAGSEDNRPYSAVPFSWMRQMVSDSRARRRILILDCCYSGRALGTMASDEGRFADLTGVEGSFVLTASSENVQAIADPGATYTAFTGALLDVISKGRENGSQFLDLDALYNFTAYDLRAASRPIPQKRDRNTAGRLTLVRNRAWQATPQNRARRIREDRQPRHARLPPLRAGFRTGVLTSTLASRFAYPLMIGENYIGRGQKNDCRIVEDHVDHQQVLIKWDGQEAWLTELSKVNMTAINGEQVTRPTRLLDTDVVSMSRGQTELFTFHESMSREDFCEWQEAEQVALAVSASLMRGSYLIDDREGIAFPLHQGVTIIGGYASPIVNLWVVHRGLEDVHLAVHSNRISTTVSDDFMVGDLRVNSIAIRRRRLTSGDVIEVGDWRAIYLEMK